MFEPPDCHPVDLFAIERDRAAASESFDPTRVALATADATGRPSVRFVLLKYVERDKGLGFFTHYDGRKGLELAQNPFASIAVHYGSTGVQLRAEGGVTRMSESESDTYFSMRPRLSQLGAWASEQSRPLESRAILESRLEHYDRTYPGRVPRPPEWGGYWLKPDSIELWVNGDGRLHDRFRWDKSASGLFEVIRLAP